MFTLELDSPLLHGGGLAFGTDGFLYVGLGSGGNEEVAGDSPGSLHGAIVRLDADVDAEGPAYAIPQGNPHQDDDEIADEIWITGIESPEILHIDPDDSSIWIAGRLASDLTGIVAIAEDLNRGRATDLRQLRELEWIPEVTPARACPIAGALPYTGDEIGELKGSVIWASTCDDALRTLAVDGSEILGEREHDEATVEEGNIAGIGTDRKGEPLIVTSSGRLYQVMRGEIPEEADTDDE